MGYGNYLSREKRELGKTIALAGSRRGTENPLIECEFEETGKKDITLERSTLR